MELNEPISQFDFFVDEDDIFWMYLTMDYVICMKIFNTFEKRWECIDEFIFWEVVFVEGSLTILEFYSHVWLSFWIQESISVK